MERWFASLYDVPIATFPVGDLARSCRQFGDVARYMRIVVPLSLQVLSQNMLSGELYDGELLVAIMELPLPYWQANPEARKALLVLSATALEQAEEDGRLRQAILRFVIATQGMQDTERPLAPLEWEAAAREIFPLNLSPEEYAAREGVNWGCFSFADYRYRDEKLDAWLQELGAIFFTPGRLHECQEALLTPDELRQVREREQEEF